MKFREQVLCTILLITIMCWITAIYIGLKEDKFISYVTISDDGIKDSPATANYPIIWNRFNSKVFCYDKDGCLVFYEYNPE